MRSFATAFCAAALLSACSGNSSRALSNYDAATAVGLNQTATSTNQNLTSDAPNSLGPAHEQVQLPEHNYSFREGDLYGYEGAISQDDQKKGIAAPPVVRFRYTGFWDGAHHLQQVNGNGLVIDDAECAVPCEAIKETLADGSIQRLGYTPESIIGAAFEDAMNGHLQRAPAVGAVSNGYRFRGGDPANLGNWERIAPAPSVERTGVTGAPFQELNQAFPSEQNATPTANANTLPENSAQPQ